MGSIMSFFFPFLLMLFSFVLLSLSLSSTLSACLYACASYHIPHPACAPYALYTCACLVSRASFLCLADNNPAPASVCWPIFFGIPCMVDVEYNRIFRSSSIAFL